MTSLTPTDSCPFTPDQIQEWASFGPKTFEKPTNPSQVAALKDRKTKVSAMKKRLALQLSDRKRWSERLIEKELDKLAAVLYLGNDDNKEQSACASSHHFHELADYQLDNSHPDNTVDHRSQGGPLLEYLWSPATEALHGQTLYLGGEVGADGKIYCIPGHASKVLVIDDAQKQVYQMGPSLESNGRQYKWLRGIVVGDIIYGLPCHADEILRIDTAAQTVTKLEIPYEAFFGSQPEEAKQQREMIWKYHGGSICPIDNCIYAIPQAASHVLKLDPTTETVSLVGPHLGSTKCKWYGGIIGKQDGALYGIPQNASGVLRIHPDAITVHGDYGLGNHKWHGGAAAANGVIVSVPANADTVLCITPGHPEPRLQLISDSGTIQSGRHRTDGKYKYLGATCSSANGRVYIFPCASEYVLQVDTSTEMMTAKNVGPNLRDTGMETVYQNKWQNGLDCVPDQCVYGISLSGHTLLRIDCSKTTAEDQDVDPEVTTWMLPTPRRECRDKFEGGVMTASGVMYTVPNNHKGVLRIEPANLTSLLDS